MTATTGPMQPPTPIMTLLEGFPTPVAWLGRDGTIRTTNRAWSEAVAAWGEPGERYPDRLAQGSTTEDGELASFDDVCSGRRPEMTIECQWSSGAGDRWWRVHAVAAEGPEGPGIMVTHLDITTARITHDALRDTEDRFDLATRGSTDGLWDWRDVRLDTMWWSPRIFQLLGYPPDSMPAGVQTLMRLLHPSDRRPLRQAMLSHLYGQTPFDVEYRLETASGEYRWFRLRGQARWDREGVPVRMTGWIHDVSDRKETERALEFRQAFERLITSISTQFIHQAPNQIDAGITLALRHIGEFMEVDRSSVYQFSDTGRATTTHTWCRHDGAPCSGLQAVPGGDFPFFLQTLQAGRLVSVPTVAGLDEAAWRERALWQQEQVESMMAVPLFSGDRVVGALVFEMTRNAKTWSDDDIALLQIAGEIMVRALDRKRSEQALRESHEDRQRQATLMEQTQASAQVGGWELDIDSNTLYWTDETYRLHETTPETYTPTVESAAGFYTPDSMPIISEAIDRVIHTGEPFDLELELVTTTGRALWVRATGTLKPTVGGSGTVYGAFQNITEQRRNQEALRQSEYRLKQAQHIAKLGSWRWQRGEDTLVWSSEMYDIFGVHAGNFTPTVKQAMTMLHPDDRSSWDMAARASLFAGEVGSYHGRIIRPDGETRHLYGRCEAEHDANGDAVQLVGVIQDVTERKQLEEQLQQSQKMEGIGRLAGGIAHDFNNILTMILGHAELAQAMTDIDDPRYEDIDTIRTAGKRAAKLTQQLLAFSRKQIIAPKVVNPNRMLLTIDAMLRRVIGEDIELVTTAAADLWHIKVDPSQFEQVLLNLAVNARDAMPTGGQLHLETHNVSLGEDYVLDHPYVLPGEFVRVVVQDTGCGMDPRTVAQIFEPFFTTKDPGKGTGLGLATCYGIVKQSGGHITVDSTPGVGSIFQLYFPRIESEAEGLEEAEVSAVVPNGKETILLVEDESAVRDLAAKVLRGRGYTVLEASLPTAALEIAGDTRPIDLLVTDVVMPHMSGKEVAEALVTARPELKVLYVSGYTEDKVVHHSVLDDDISFLAKPFTANGLARKVREVLDERARPVDATPSEAA